MAFHIAILLEGAVFVLSRLLSFDCDSPDVKLHAQHVRELSLQISRIPDHIDGYPSYDSYL